MILLITNVSNVTKLMGREVQVKGKSLIMHKLYHVNREENSVYRCEMTELKQYILLPKTWLYTTVNYLLIYLIKNTNKLFPQCIDKKFILTSHLRVEMAAVTNSNSIRLLCPCFLNIPLYNFATRGC